MINNQTNSHKHNVQRCLEYSYLFCIHSTYVNTHLLPASVGRFCTSAGLSFSLLLSLFLADGVLDLDLLPFGDFSLGDLLRLPPLGDLGDLDLSDFPVPGRESGDGV